MFKWDDLSVLLAVHRAGTLAGAAAALRVDPSTVSRRLRALERDLDARLFDRTPDGLAATDLAMRLFPHAEQAEAAAMAVGAEAAGAEVEAKGLVRVAMADAFAAYVVAPGLAGFASAHPGLRLDLVVGVSLVDLARREADIAVRYVRPTRGDLVAKQIDRTSRYCAFVSRHYVRDGPLRWIGWNESMAHLPEARLYEEVVGRAPDVAADNMVVMLEALRAGAGAMLLPEDFASRATGAVMLDDPAPVPFELTTWLVMHRALRHVPRVRVVWNWLERIVRGAEPAG